MKIIDGKPEYRGALVSVGVFEFVCCMNWWTHFCVWKKTTLGVTNSLHYVICIP